MKKIIALILVLMLALTVFVACKKDPETPADSSDKPTSDSVPSGDTSESTPDSSDTEEVFDPMHHDVEGLEKDNYKGEGIELPIIPVG